MIIILNNDKGDHEPVAIKRGPHYQLCVTLLLNKHSSNSNFCILNIIYLFDMVHSNSLSCYELYYITISCMPLVILNFTSVCSVKVSHTTDSDDPA